MTKPLAKISSQKGQALVYAMVISAVVGGGVYYFLGRTKVEQENLKVSKYKYSIEMFKENVMATIDNDSAWIKTVQLNPSLNCLATNGATCNASSFGPIKIYNADGTVVLDTAPAMGFDGLGESCNKFNVGNGNSCIFKYTVTWSCNGPCTPTVFLPGLSIASSPRIKIIGKLELSSSSQSINKSILNKNKVSYSIDMLRGAKERTLSQYCNSIDGIFDQKNTFCRSKISPYSTFDCSTPANPHRWFVGFTKEGVPICKDDIKLNSQCGGGAAVVGYNPDGSLLCGAF